MAHQFDLTGKVAVVTGCNTGLGQGMAIGLAEAGADIVGLNRSDDRETAQAVGDIGRKYWRVDLDLSDTTQVKAALDEVVGITGRIDILVNNAGMIRRGEALEFSEQDWDDVMNVNLKSLFLLCQAAAQQFVRQGSRGKIINIASMLSFQGGIKVASYTASKHGVVGITRILANELASHRINVNAIAPGYMETNNTAPLRKDQKRNAEILGRIPAGRWGTPDDLKGAVVFLAAPASDYVTGHVLAVDGGWLAR